MTIKTKFNYNQSVYFIEDSKVLHGLIIKITAVVGTFAFNKYDMQTGIDSGAYNIPEHLIFLTREDAERELKRLEETD